MKNSWKPILLTLIALSLFSLIFLGITFNFWIQMSLSVSALCLLSFVADLRGMRFAISRPAKSPFFAILLGLISAVGLYLFFFIANWAARKIFPFGGEEISEVYSLKNNTSSLLITALIAFIIAPGEEIFWRGYLQRTLQDRYKFMGTILAITAYTAAHLSSGNLMLIAASAACGTFWSIIYWKYKCLWMVIISHIAWDLAVFVIWPLNN